MDGKTESDKLAQLLKQQEENAFREYAVSITDQNAPTLIKGLDRFITSLKDTDPQKGRALYLKGVALLKIKQYASARKCIDEAVGFNNPSAMLFLAISPALGFNSNLVVPLYMRALELDPSIAKLKIDISSYENDLVNNYQITTNKIKLGLYFFKTKYMGQEDIETFYKEAIEFCNTCFKRSPYLNLIGSYEDYLHSKIMEKAKESLFPEPILSVLADAILTALSRIPQSFGLGDDKYITKENRYFRDRTKKLQAPPKLEQQRVLKKALKEAKGFVGSTLENKKTP